MTSEARGTADIEIDVEALNKRYAEERAKRMRGDANAQYARLEGKFADFDRDIYADPNFTRAAVDEQLDVLPWDQRGDPSLRHHIQCTAPLLAGVLPTRCASVRRPGPGVCVHARAAGDHWSAQDPIGR